jgi:beta-glucosidase
VRYSADASAPIRPAEVGVVVVGETPYSEGFGDVGGPRWAYDPGDNGVPRPVKDMQLSSADKAPWTRSARRRGSASWSSSPAAR